MFVSEQHSNQGQLSPTVALSKLVDTLTKLLHMSSSITINDYHTDTNKAGNSESEAGENICRKTSLRGKYSNVLDFEIFLF